MILLPRAVRVYFATAPANLRKSFEGLSNEVRSVLVRDPLSGHVFVFLNRRRNQVKLLVWERTGEMLHGLQAVGVLRRSLCQSIRFAIVRYASCGPSVGPNIRRACGI